MLIRQTDQVPTAKQDATIVNYPYFQTLLIMKKCCKFLRRYTHTCGPSTLPYRSHPVKIYRSHTSRPVSGTHLQNIKNHTIPAGHASVPINMCGSYRSYRPHPHQHEQIIQITQDSTQVDHTDPADYTHPADHTDPTR